MSRTLFCSAQARVIRSERTARKQHGEGLAGDGYGGEGQLDGDLGEHRHQQAEPQHQGGVTREPSAGDDRVDERGGVRGELHAVDGSLRGGGPFARPV